MTPDLLALKRATAEMVKGVGGVEAAASFCRVGKSTLSDAQNMNKDDCFVALDVIADLEPLARSREGWPHVTRNLCQIMGGTFVALPDAPATREDLLSLLASLTKELSEVTAAVCTGLADNNFDQTDARKTLTEVDDAIRVAAAMRAALQTIVES
ncbi:hypothetical protein KCP91_08260 [Microvirga sp. SRT01]|uniref:Transcriptional regulator n=1 Tax=Sphingomonas longa TaxID=2778730 RepID=A0ABS2D601_9SPHN|nr:MULTISPECIES: phage regulatory CII family protein [Alphaproteobacteria]MBM6576364.1 hypothetical protein [Sphingomonas sp. BT552]MBR7709410.1 hypothetical protein [Microvirga sp. SRT01]